jgi:hypothetical protein
MSGWTTTGVWPPSCQAEYPAFRQCQFVQRHKLHLIRINNLNVCPLRLAEQEKGIEQQTVARPASATTVYMTRRPNAHGGAGAGARFTGGAGIA